MLDPNICIRIDKTSIPYITYVILTKKAVVLMHWDTNMFKNLLDLSCSQILKLINGLTDSVGRILRVQKTKGNLACFSNADLANSYSFLYPSVFAIFSVKHSLIL